MIGDLTTLARVTDWLNAGTTAPFPPDDNPLLSRLITACSGFIQNYLSRAIVPQQYVETFNGNNQAIRFVKNRPILSVSAVSMNGTAIAASPAAPNQSGYAFDDTRLYLIGWVWLSGFQNCSITYVSGFQTTTQQTIVNNPAPTPVSGFEYPFNQDMGVTVGGVALTKITAGDPASGEYKVAALTDGSFGYYFNADVDGQTATITYGYTPYDLGQVVIETVGEAYKRRSRIGQTSINLGNGQTVQFSLKDFNAANCTLLNQYKNVVPG